MGKASAFWFLFTVALTMVFLAVDTENLPLKIIGLFLSAVLVLIAVAGVVKR